MKEIADSLSGKMSKTLKEGYPPALSRIETFFVRRLYARACGCFNQPICSNPGAYVDVLGRKRIGDQTYSRDFEMTGEKIHCLNLGSYNYLGFSETQGPVSDSVVKSLSEIGLSQCSPPHYGGKHELLGELEESVARFLNKEAAIVWGMGWGVNATGISSIAGRGSLIISDALNHASLVVGCRASGGVVKVFKHNDAKDLEKVIRRAIIEGQPITRRPWKKIIIMLEGTYSMEGEFPPLKEMVELKKKYKCYLYIDEAHSIGAIGTTGRGICEHLNIDTSEVDIMMGTFTKSFGAAGGYMASTRELIDYIRATSFAMYYENSMPIPVAQQTLSALRVISGEDGTSDGKQRIRQLKENSQYFRNRLREMKFKIIGNNECPIVPLMIYHPVKLHFFFFECLRRGLAVAIVSFPATPLTLARARFCLSSGHTKEDLDKALDILEEIGSNLMLKYDRTGWDSLRALFWD